MVITVQESNVFFTSYSRSLQTSVPAVSGSGEKDPGSGVIFESKNKVLDNVQTSLGSWSNAQISQQVRTFLPHFGRERWQLKQYHFLFSCVL